MWIRRGIINEESQSIRLAFSGAENGARTRDLNLGKVALYQLSYFRKSLLLSVGIAKIDTFFESPKFFLRFFTQVSADNLSVAQHLSALHPDPLMGRR